MSIFCYTWSFSSFKLPLSVTFTKMYWFRYQKMIHFCVLLVTGCGCSGYRNLLVAGFAILSLWSRHLHSYRTDLFMATFCFFIQIFFALPLEYFPELDIFLSNFHNWLVNFAHDRRSDKTKTYRLKLPNLITIKRCMRSGTFLMLIKQKAEISSSGTITEAPATKKVPQRKFEQKKP